VAISSARYGQTNCYDIGAVQTEYALGFTTEPPAPPTLVNPGVAISPAPAVTVTEDGTPLTAVSASVSVTDTASPSDVNTAGSTLTASTSTATATAGQASFGNLVFTGYEASDTLKASLALNGTVSASALSTAFTVGQPLAATVAVASKTLTQNYAATPFTPVTGSGGDGTLSYSVSPTLPSGLSLNTTTGQVSGTATVASAATLYTVLVKDQNGASAQAQFSLTVDSAVTATVNIPSQTLTVNLTVSAFTPVTGGGGDAPLRYGVSPTLPAGLAMSATTGAISGLPTSPTAAASYTVTVTDQNGASAQAQFSLTVDGAVTATTAVASTTLTQNFAATAFTPVTGGGGYSPLSYGVSPALPAGLSFSTTTGQVTGTATGVSPATPYTVTVKDQNGASAQAQFSLTVDGAVTATTAVASTTLTQNLAATSFTPVTGSGGYGTLSYSVSPALPAGLSFSTTTGQVTGTATGVSAAAPYTVTVKDQNGASAQAQFSLTVDSGVTATVTVPSTTLTFYQAVTPLTPVSGSGGYGTLSYSVSPSLPAGLSFNTTNGQLTGTPTSVSTSASYNVTVKDQNGASATQGFSLAVAKQASTTTVSLSSASITPLQTVTLTATVAPSVTGSPTPTLTVTFFDGSTQPATQLGSAVTLSNGVAQLMNVTLLSGPHAIYAVYSGDGNYLTSTSSVNANTTVTVAAEDFTFTASSYTTQSVVPGTAGVFTFQLAPLYDKYPGPVLFTVTGLPPGATYTVTPATIAANAGPQTVTVTINTPQAIAMRAVGRSAPWAFALLLPVIVLRRARKKLSHAVALALLLSAGAVGISGCGSNANGYFGQSVKNYTVTVTGTSGAVTHSSSIPLQVQ
jgi:hypothetical protein